MSRIEEIQQAINRYQEERFMYAQGDHPDWSEDVEYLLSKLDNLENSLKTIAAQTLVVNNDIVSRTKKLEIAEKALHKIAYETLDDGSIAMFTLMKLEKEDA